MSEAKLKALKKHVSTAIKKGGSYSDDDIEQAVANDKDKEGKHKATSSK